MSIFLWEGIEGQGNLVRGEIVARNKKEVIQILLSRSINPKLQSIQKKGINIGLNFDWNFDFISNFFSNKKIKNKDIAIFFKKLSTLINSGVTVISSFEALEKQCTNQKLKEVISSIKKDIKCGKKLEIAFSKFPKIFNSVFLNMIKVGEVSGNVDKILEKISFLIERKNKISSQIKMAMAYPVSVLVISILVTISLLIFVVPTFEDIYKDFNTMLPLPTRIVIFISNFLQDNFLFLFFVAICAVLGGLYFYKSKDGKEFFDKLFFKMPIVSSFKMKGGTSRFFLVFSMMISAGVSVYEALKISKNVINNIVIQKKFLIVEERINEGERLSLSLSSQKIFPEMVTEMISVGEEGGSLDLMTNSISNFYDEELQNSCQMIKQSLEPIMILILGLIIGGIVLSMYYPIFELGKITG